MPRPKLKNKNTRKLIRIGGSVYVSLPKEIITALNWRNTQKVVVKKAGNTITIKDWEK